MKQKASSGQVVLITLLVLTIATTVALSLISRTTTDTTITNQIEESSRAFNAAEAGVEEALKTGNGTSGPTAIVGAAGVTYNVTVNTIGGGGATGVYEFPKKSTRDTTETFWLVDHNDATGQISEIPTYTAPSIGLCWSSETVPPAMFVTLLYKTAGGVYNVAKGAFDPVPTDPSRGTTANHFTVTPSGDCGANSGTAYREDITFTSLNPAINPANDTLIALRIRPLYSDATIALDLGVEPIQKQGKSIQSVGSTASGTNRKIMVYQEYRTPGTEFDSALYSQSSLIQ